MNRLIQSLLTLFKQPKKRGTKGDKGPKPLKRLPITPVFSELL